MLYEENAPSYRYFKKLLGFGPIALWLMNEQTGLVSYDISGNGFDGAYTGVTLAQPGIGDGNLCPFFDGVNDYLSITIAGLLAAFNGSEGTIVGWDKVANAAVWVDGTERRFVDIEGPGGYILMRRLAANNTMEFRYNAGGVNKFVQISTNTTAWMHCAITWSASAGATGEVRAYIQGTQSGATQVNLGVFGAAPTSAILGAANIVPQLPWHGWMAHWALFNYALTPTQIAYLYLP